MGPTIGECIGIKHIKNKFGSTLVRNMNRSELLKKAGNMVLCHYAGVKNEECFAIGWFYAMNEDSIKLKVTSTAFETYENITIEVESIIKMEDYRRD